MSTLAAIDQTESTGLRALIATNVFRIGFRVIYGKKLVMVVDCCIYHSNHVDCEW